MNKRLRNLVLEVDIQQLRQAIQEENTTTTTIKLIPSLRNILQKAYDERNATVHAFLEAVTLPENQSHGTQYSSSSSDGHSDRVSGMKRLYLRIFLFHRT